MTDCDEIRLLLGAFQDGELEPHEIAVVEAHLDDCSGCVLALREYGMLGVALRELPTVPIPAPFAQNVVRRITRLHGGWGTRLAQLRESLGAFGSALEIAAVAAVAAIMTVMIATPYVHNFDSGRSVGARSFQVAGQTSPSSASPPSAGAPLTLASNIISQSSDTQPSGAQNVVGKIEDADAAATLDSQEVMSALGGGPGPSVAVWNEPRTDTTVVWIPDQR